MNSQKPVLAAALAFSMLYGCGDDPERMAPGADGGADGGVPEEGGFSAADGDAKSQADGTFSDANGNCAWADARPTARPAAIWIVVEPSMLEKAFREADGTTTRSNREALRALLFAQGGLVERFQQAAPFGLVSHGAPNGFGMQCPQGFVEPAALNNAARLRQTYDEKLARDYTDATGPVSWASLDAIAGEISKQTTPMRNQILMLEESGTMDGLCNNLLSEPGTPRTRASVQSLAAQGARVSVVTFLASERDTSNVEEFNRKAREANADLASLGKGEAFAASEGPGLLAAVERFVSEGVSCEISLEGAVEANRVCEGEVKLGEQPLPCNQPDGFRLIDDSTLELTGKACDRLRGEGAAVSARFPCDVITLY